jgi:hypothetical protein
LTHDAAGRQFRTTNALGFITLCKIKTRIYDVADRYIAMAPAGFSAVLAVEFAQIL